jgi:hypothetical protein
MREYLVKMPAANKPSRKTFYGKTTCKLGFTVGTSGITVIWPYCMKLWLASLPMLPATANLHETRNGNPTLSRIKMILWGILFRLTNASLTTSPYASTDWPLPAAHPCLRPSNPSILCSPEALHCLFMTTHPDSPFNLKI